MNILGGLLIGFGAAFALGTAVAGFIWVGEASPTPNPALGLIAPFDNGGKGPTIYLTRFKASSLGALPMTGAAMTVLGFLLTPKIRRGGRNLYDRDDEAWRRMVPKTPAPGCYLIGALAGASAAGAVFVFSRL